jgi:hypothetical protein
MTACSEAWTHCRCPAWLCRQQPELIEAFVQQAKKGGWYVLVDSPVRYRPDSMDPVEALAEVGTLSVANGLV